MEDVDDVIAFLKGRKLSGVENYPRDLISRIKYKYPYPILRHHLGLPSLMKRWIGEQIAEAKV